MLWEHTGWETMFFYGRSDLHGLAVCIFASTNVLLGLLGFSVCAALVRADRHSVAHSIWTSAYVATFAVATFGYNRAFYAGESTVLLSCYCTIMEDNYYNLNIIQVQPCNQSRSLVANNYRRNIATGLFGTPEVRRRQISSLLIFIIIEQQA